MTQTEDRIFVSLFRTINLGNYNNVKIEAAYETNVRKGEAIEGAYERAWLVVDGELESQINQALEADK